MFALGKVVNITNIKFCISSRHREMHACGIRTGKSEDTHDQTKAPAARTGG